MKKRKININWKSELKDICEAIPPEMTTTSICKLVSDFRRDSPFRPKKICRDCGKEFLTFLKQARVCDDCKDKKRQDKKRRCEDQRQYEIEQRKKQNEQAKTTISNKSASPYERFQSLKSLITITDEQKLADLPYDEFLDSIYWDIIRKYKLYESRYTCVLCGKTNTLLNVHHKTYVHRGSEYKNLQDLIVLCSDCHKKVHGIEEENTNE